MAELVLSEAIPRFKQNEDRMDRFTNGDASTTWITSGGTPVPSIQKFLADRWAEINTPGLGWLALAEAAAGAANDDAGRSENARDAAEDAAAVLNTATLSGTGLFAVSNPLLKNSPTGDVPIASEAEARAGAINNKAVTPLRGKQIVEDWAELAKLTPSWTEGRTQTIRKLLRDWCKLGDDTQFDPTGTTNMTALVTRALTEYDTVRVPERSTAAIANLNIPGNNKRLVGEGRTATFRMPNSTNTNMILCYNRTGLEVENLGLEGNNVAQIAGNGTDIQGSSHVIFQGVRFTNWFGNGFIAQVSCNDVNVINCLFQNIGSHGISLSAVNGSKVEGNRIFDARLAGVNYGACGNGTCANNRILRNPALGATGGGAGGIRTTNTSTVITIVGNIISSYDRGIMLITGAGLTSCIGNVINQPWYDGYFIQGASPLASLDISIIGGVVFNANQSNAGSYDGVRIDGDVGAVVMKGIEIRDARGASQMQYGIRDTSTGAPGNIARALNENWIGGAAIAATN